MPYYTFYTSELVGRLTLASDGDALTGCWFDDDRHFGYGARGPFDRKDDLPVFVQAHEWLDRYFSDQRPDPHELPLGNGALSGFQLRVRKAMLAIPYGSTSTYGDIAKAVQRATGARSSARAVGGAVGRNPLCVIVPCHRVVGANGSLTGFGGGVSRKVALLEHEGVDMSRLSVPTKGTALEGIPNAARRILS